MNGIQMAEGGLTSNHSHESIIDYSGDPDTNSQVCASFLWQRKIVQKQIFGCV